MIFTIYAPTVFATLRAALGISHEDFLMVRPPQKIYSIAITIVMFGSKKCKKSKSIMGVGTYNYTFKSVVIESVKVKSVKIFD